LVEHKVAPAPEDSLDRTLAAVDIPKLLLDLSTAPADGPVADWLTSKPPSRWIGAVYSDARVQEYMHNGDPRGEFDILAFVERTTAARANPTGRRPAWSQHEPVEAAANMQLAGCGDVPDAWASSGNWRAHGHAVALSDERTPAGGRTVCISRIAAPWRWGEGWLAQTFLAEPWRGKRLRFGGAVRAEVQEPGASAQLYVEIRPKPPEGAIWAMPASGVAMIDPSVRSPDWASYCVEIDVPPEAHSIVIGCALAGSGAAWFGDLELEAA
jgi:hypothetical protein